MTLKKIISLCEKYGFLRLVASGEIYKVESTGLLLQENLRAEWFNNIVINKDIPIFPSLGGFTHTFDFAKEMCMETPPFGVAQFQEQTCESADIDVRGHFGKGTVFECYLFSTPSGATQLFHQWQRERRMWWRKFSASPGRYVLTGVENGESPEVGIVAKYPWGDQRIEILTLKKGHDCLSQEQLQVKDGKKTVSADCVVSRTYLPTMLLNTLCDAYDEPLFQGAVRPLLRLHRRLAPYKISFSIPSGQKSVTDELKELAIYLCRRLKKNHVSCLLTPISHRNTLEAQWRQYDQMGVPYNVLLNENTLKTGVMFLRSRDTTLKEQVHVSGFTEYVEQLFKNY